MMALILRAAGSTASEAEVRRCVTIDEAKNEIVEIYHINELSQSDRAEIWLTAQDVMETKKQYTKIVRMMMRSHEPLEETDECCCRGLEFRTKEGSRRRKKIKQKGMLAVLDEQEMQIEEGVDDPDFIRDVYKESASGQSSLEALNRGLKDQKVMLAFLDPQTRRERDQRMRSSKNVIIDAPKMPLRRSITEILLNGSEMQGRGIITPPK